MTEGDNKGLTPAHIACMHGHRASLAWILDTIQRTYGGRQALTQAVNAKDSRKRSPLHYAVSSALYVCYGLVLCEFPLNNDYDVILLRPIRDLLRRAMNYCDQTASRQTPVTT